VTASWFFARAELRRHRARWTLLALAIALIAAVVVAGVGGARRTGSVYRRFGRHNRLSNTALLVDGVSSEQLVRIRALSEIEGSTLEYRFPGRLSRSTSSPDGPTSEDPMSDEIVLNGGPRFGLDVDRFSFVSGRAPVAPDEIVLDSLSARQTGLRVGAVVTFAPYLPNDGDAPPHTAAPERLRVTGVVTTGDELGRLPGALGGFTSASYHSGAPSTAAPVVLAVRLRDEPGVFDRFQAALTRLRDADPTLPAGVAAIGDSGDTASRVQTALDALAATLLVIAATVFLEGLVILATSLSRIYGERPDDPLRLAAIGASRRQRTGSLALPAVVVGVPAVFAGAIAAWFASDRFPVSSARQLETSPGRTIDWVATAGCSAILLATIVAAVIIVAWRAAATGSRRAEQDVARGRRRVRSGMWVAPLGTAIATGTRFAFDRRGARTPIRTASAGLIIGTTGVVAILTVGFTLQRVETTPARYGWNWDVAVNGTLTRAQLERYGVGDDVAAAAVVRGSIVKLPFGATWSFDMTAVKGALEFTTLRGRLPIGPGELAAGPVWLRAHHLDVGDVVKGAEGVPDITVSGEALVPAFDDDAIGGTVIVHDRAPSPDVRPVVRTALRLQPGASPDDVLARLERALPTGSVDARSAPLVPVEVRNLTRTLALQRVLAALLGASAAAALVHLILSANRQRRKELATLRTLGLTSRQAGLALVWAGVSATAFGVSIGVPVGISLGITAWRIIATSIGVATDATVPAVALATVMLVSVVAAATISALPAIRAARIRPGEALRDE
jgi:putative ABC transport system permease protein